VDGNADAALVLTLGDVIRGRPKEFRWFRRDQLPHWIEAGINPSRVLQSLERRALIRRHKAPGWVLPTQAGRAFVKCFEGNGEALRISQDVARRHPNAGFRTGCHVPFKAVSTSGGAMTSNDGNWTREDEERLQELLERSGRRVAAAYNPANEYDAAELKDLIWATALLTGEWSQKGSDPENREADRFPAKRYLEGELETQARQAIGRLLRGTKPLDASLRLHLAELFDGLGPHSSFDAVPMERRLILGGKSNSQGPADVTLRDLHMVSDYYIELSKAGGVHKKARQAICKEYNISDTVLKEARRKFPDLANNQHLSPEGGQ
jgi:hypothetical protein